MKKITIGNKTFFFLVPFAGACITSCSVLTDIYYTNRAFEATAFQNNLIGISMTLFYFISLVLIKNLPVSILRPRTRVKIAVGGWVIVLFAPLLAKNTNQILILSCFRAIPMHSGCKATDPVSEGNATRPRRFP